MRRGRRTRPPRLPILAELAGPAPGEGPWSLRRDDLEALHGLLGELEERRTVLATGSASVCGVLAVALAGAAAAAGRRAALLECELEGPRLAAEVGLAARPGLHEYLRWEAEAPAILQPLVLAGPGAREARAHLTCVVGGRPAADPATLLGLDSFRHAVAKLRAAYELVVLDGPGLDGDPSALDAVASHADAVLVCLTPGQRSGRAGRAMRAAARRLAVPPQGAVVLAEPRGD